MSDFEPADSGLDLPTNQNHLIFKYTKTEGKILFSLARQGNGASVHFASDKKGVKNLRSAITDFINFVFERFEWCEMIFAKVKNPKVGRIVKRFGFSELVKDGDVTAYMRLR